MATFAIKTQILCFCIPPKSLINACMERENSTLILRPHLVLLSQHTRSVREGCIHRKETPTQRHTLASCIYIICRFKHSQACTHSSTVQLVFHSLTFLPLSCVCWGQSHCQNISAPPRKKYTTLRPDCTHTSAGIKYTFSQIQRPRYASLPTAFRNMSVWGQKTIRWWKTI